MHQVSILCTDPDHPVNKSITAWAKTQEQTGLAKVNIFQNATELIGGDFLFLVSCNQIVGKLTRDLFRHTLVLHASPLPLGRGMSPHIWQILEGKNEIPVTLLNAEDAIDTGALWHQIFVQFDGTELHDEINTKIFDAEIQLFNWALLNCDQYHPRAQQGTPSFYRRRSPADSAIDITRSFAEAFELLRVADPERYPAFFEIRGQKYRVRIDKV